MVLSSQRGFPDKSLCDGIPVHCYTDISDADTSEDDSMPSASLDETPCKRRKSESKFLINSVKKEQCMYVSRWFFFLAQVSIFNCLLYISVLSVCQFLSIKEPIDQFKPILLSKSFC